MRFQQRPETPSCRRGSETASLASMQDHDLLDRLGLALEPRVHQRAVVILGRQRVTERPGRFAPAIPGLAAIGVMIGVSPRTASGKATSASALNCGPTIGDHVVGADQLARQVDRFGVLAAGVVDDRASACRPCRRSEYFSMNMSIAFCCWVRRRRPCRTTGSVCQY